MRYIELLSNPSNRVCVCVLLLQFWAIIIFSLCDYCIMVHDLLQIVNTCKQYRNWNVKQLWFLWADRVDILYNIKILYACYISKQLCCIYLGIKKRTHVPGIWTQHMVIRRLWVHPRFCLDMPVTFYPQHVI